MKKLLGILLIIFPFALMIIFGIYMFGFWVGLIPVGITGLVVSIIWAGVRLYFN